MKTAASGASVATRLSKRFASIGVFWGFEDANAAIFDAFFIFINDGPADAGGADV